MKARSFERALNDHYDDMDEGEADPGPGSEGEGELVTIQTHFINEPLLEIGSGQKVEHPQDGLFLYGPVIAQGSPEVVHVGIVGTPDGIQLVSQWLGTLMGRIPVKRPDQLNTSE